MRKIILKCFLSFLFLALLAVVGSSFYMLDDVLAPDSGHRDSEACMLRQFEEYPETKNWVDSLRRVEALRDTFLTMPSGERHHAFFVWKGSRRTAFLLHGWRNCAVDVFFLGRLYEQLLDCNVVMPDLHAHGQSEGDAIGMGWLDRLDVLSWMNSFASDSIIVHGVSMGGALSMILAGEDMPVKAKDMRFVDDCGYTSVWDELQYQLRKEFSLPPFPLMYTTSMLCRLKNGWSFGEGAAVDRIAKSPYPMLFIHGDSDTFVPTEMVKRLYEAKPSPKFLWIVPDTDHALSYKNHKQAYLEHLEEFVR